MDKKAKNNSGVTIVGAGIVGICTALSALQRGNQVCLIDPSPPASGASSGNAGVISPWSCVPQSLPGLWKNIPKWMLDPDGPLRIRLSYLPKLLPWTIKFLKAGQTDRIPRISDAMDVLVRSNTKLYRQHLGGTGHENLLVDSLYIHTYRNENRASPHDLGWKLRQLRGADVEVVSGGALREIEPALSPDYTSAMLIKDQARTVSPEKLGQVLAEKFCQLGGEIRCASVLKIMPVDGGNWWLDTNSGDISAEKLVISAGAWSTQLLKPLGLSIPLEYEHGYHLMFSNPGVTLSHSVMDVDFKFVTSSMTGGIRSAGTAEFSGLNGSPDYRRARIFSHLTKKMLPALNTDNSIEWRGTRPSLPDSLPCLGAIPRYPNLFAAFGHSHFGLGMAPQTGEIIADLLSGVDTGIDMIPYRVDRF